MVQKSGDHQLRLVVYPIVSKVLYIPGGAGFLPSTVVHECTWNYEKQWSVFLERLLIQSFVVHFSVALAVEVPS